MKMHHHEDIHYLALEAIQNPVRKVTHSTFPKLAFEALVDEWVVADALHCCSHGVFEPLAQARLLVVVTACCFFDIA